MEPQLPKPLISVVIPAFNYADKLERALDSALSQPGEDFDLWIVDDGSTDATPDLAAFWAQRWPGRVHYRRQTNQGPAAARNHGLDASRGAYLLFLDADDALLPRALAAFREALIAHPEAQVILAGHESVHPRGGAVKPHRPPRMPATPVSRLRAYLLQKTLPICHGAVLFRRDVFAHYRYPEHFRGAEDIPLFAYAICNFFCVAQDTPTVRVHQHAQSLRNDAARAAHTGLRLVEEIFDATRLPASAMALKKPYLVRRHLSLFRTLFHGGNHGEALSHYRSAFWLSPMETVRPRYLGKALRAGFAHLLCK